MRHNLNILLYTVLIQISTIWGYNILMVCPLPSRSHHNLCKAIVDILGDDGHNMTFISAFPKNNSSHREIGVMEMTAAVNSSDRRQSKFSLSNITKINEIIYRAIWQQTIASLFFSNHGVKNILNDPNEKFDLVIYEYSMNDYMMGFSVHFDCPSIILSPIPMMSWLATMTGNPLSIATIPNGFTQFSQTMNLKERTINTIFILCQDLMGTFIFRPIFKRLYQKYFPVESEKIPYEELQNFISLIFVNGNPVLSGARPLLPNTIEIGGYHILDTEPLPQDLKQILDNAKEGVVYFSMGSFLQSSEMDPELIDRLLKAIASIKQTVLWKFEKNLPNKPKNLIIRKWMPQVGILAHPNVKLFMTHGGLLSCIEATSAGVPLLIMPIYGDQHHNAMNVQEKGQGLFIEFNNVTETSLKWGLQELLNNQKYILTAKRLQKLLNDRPMKPSDLIKYYTRHVIETGGAAHLSQVKLPRCSQMLLDVTAVIIIPSVLFLYIIISCCRYCCCKKIKTHTITLKNSQKKTD